jgi:hypothetical protein
MDKIIRVIPKSKNNRIHAVIQYREGEAHFAQERFFRDKETGEWKRGRGGFILSVAGADELKVAIEEFKSMVSDMAK